MAALVEPAPLELRDLRSLRAPDLEPLLAEETAVWRDSLDWEFAKSADLVRKFVGLQALNGAALVHAGSVVGYTYYVLEDHKGLVGDLYLQKAWQHPAHEQRLLSAVLEEMVATTYVRRIETQLMMLSGPLTPRLHLQAYPREFMVRALPAPVQAPSRSLSSPVIIAAWADQHQEAAAQMIASTYAGHPDSAINDQYRSAAGARRFLYNIVQYPGCGAFHQPASFSAFHRGSSELCGISLASIVGPGCGHITQLCVAPAQQGTGLGRALLVKSMASLAAAGCRKVSLTVTTANIAGLHLYRKLGFRRQLRFCAYVWEGW